MTIYSLLKTVHAKGIKLWQENGQLKINAPKGALTKEVREQIVVHKVELLGFFNQASTSKKIPQLLPVKRDELESNPLSFVQERLWVLNQLNIDGVGYNIPIAFIFKGKLDISLLNDAFNKLIQRHETLRTLFFKHEGQAQQKIKNSLEFKFEALDVSSAKTKKERYSKAKKIGELEASAPFNLSKGPLARGKVIRISSQEHVIIITMHHIISDDWSVNILLKELFTIYDAIKKGGEDNITPLPIQYLDFCVWQRQWLKQGEELDRQLAYWKQKLSGVPESLDLMTDYPRPGIQSFNGTSQKFVIDAQLARQLKNLSEKHGCTLYMILLSVFKTLMYRYTGQEDICIGGVVANRQLEETHGLIGMFVNTVALRTLVDSDDSFVSVLNKVKATCGEAYEYQDTPFDKIVDQLKIQRNLALNPMFQIMVSQNIPLDFSNKNIEPFELDRQSSKFDMHFEFTETTDGIHGLIEYCSDLFNQQTIERLISNFIVLSNAVITNPNDKIINLEILTKEEKQKLLIDFNSTQITYEKGKCIHHLFIEQVKQSPNKIAVIHNNEQLSYQQLYDKSLVLALYLQSKGVEPESLVGVCMDRSIDMLVALLGILQAGGAYIPLDSAYPDNRIAFMLEDSKAGFVLTQESLTEKLGKFKLHNTELISIDKQWVEISDTVAKLKTKKIKLNQNVTSNNLAYVIYTSGSTGKPKGVAIEHHSTVVLLDWAKGVYDKSELSGVLASTSVCFDLSVYEIFLPLSVGGKIILAPDALALINLPNRDSITLINTVPSVMEELVRHQDAIPDSVVTINLAGEPLSPTLVDKIYKHSKVGKVYDLYGPSEDTTYSTFALRKKNGAQTIGCPISNTQAFILDKFNNPLPVGIPGELHLSGDGLAREYLNRPELTKEKFVPNPFNPGTLMYKTGDRARWKDNNTIEYLGRIDTQVKIRGFRIEIGEIETALGNYQGIKECVVVDQGQGANKKLVAFYVTEMIEGIADFSNEKIKKHLMQFLPYYMIPSVFVSLPSIPLTQNGKINRRELQNMELSVETGHDYIAPKKEEYNLVSLWAKVLNIKPELIGVNDKFFDLGGNSLSAVSLAASIEKSTNVPFAPVDLFKYSTIRSIGKYLKEKANSDKENTSQKQKISVPSEKKVIKERSFNDTEVPEYYKDSLAIVGISCNFPEADDHWQFWKNLVDGRESINLLSKEEVGQYNVSPEYLNNPQYVPLKPWMEGKEFFDHEFFQISSGNAAMMDPQFRQLLMHSWKAVEDAGYRNHEIEKTSVFMSASANFYQALGAKIASEGHVMENSEEFVSWIMSQGGTIPTMISYQLGLKGASAFVHSNCSSALTALYYAYQSLQSKDADYALVGASTLSASLSLGYMQMPGMNFSSDGHCKTFDANADGMVDGEGVGVLLIKRAVDAVKDGDNIYCVLRGISINNDGSDKVGFYAPSVNGQTSVIQNVLDKTGINPETISYVEAHGTGTALGDPIEVKAISEAFRKYTDKKQFCAIGSVKPNIGHLDTAAGLAGCIKLAVSLYNKKLSPLINYKSANPHIDFENSPFYVLDQEQAWTADQYPKRVAISSFGIGGTNGHAIFEEYNKADVSSEETVSSELFLVPLSAKREDVLLEYAQNLLKFLDRNIQNKVKLSDLAFTMQMGREEMNFRLVFVVKTIDELIEELRAFVENKSSEAYFKGEVNINKKSSESLDDDEDYLELIKHWFIKKKVRKLARLWVSGTKLDWKLLYNGQYLKRISLPTYPFAKIRCWLDNSFSDKPALAGDRFLASASIHPLLHSNISDFSKQSYRSLFTGKEFFLADHQINGQKVFPAVAYLEMAQIATMQATSGLFDFTMLELLDVVWIQPIVVEKETEVIINLSADENGQIAYEVVSNNDEQTSVHCEGKVEFKDEPLEKKLEVGQLLDQMVNDSMDSNDVYALFSKKATKYGLAHRPVKKIWKGKQQLLAELNLPQSFDSSFNEFVLHPSIMDGALQASNVLFDDLFQSAEQDVLPFALESLRIVSGYSKDSLVWVRLAKGSRPDDKIIKLDIDLSDKDGNVNVKMRGFSFRMVSKNHLGSGKQEFHLTTPFWQPDNIDSLVTQNTIKTDFKKSVIVLSELPDIHIDRLEKLLPGGQFKQINSELKSLADRYNELALICFEDVQNIIKNKPVGKVHFQLVLGNDPEQSLLAGLSGLFKTASMENPNISGQIILIDAQTPTEHIAKLLIENQSKPEDLFVKYLQGIRNTIRWNKIDSFENKPKIPFKDNGVYVITGGLGGLGVLFTKEIIKQVPNARIILTGRSELSVIKKEALDILNSVGATVEYIQMELDKLKKVEKVVSSIYKKYNGLNGILHSAGMISDSFILKKTHEEFSNVLAPKVNGTTYLDQACQHIDLDFFVLFSSISAKGSVGQADYATANAFMDQFASYRNQLVKTGQRKGKTIAINWPLWQDGGMQIDEATFEMLQKTSGLNSMSTGTGMQLFYQSIDLEYSQVLVAQNVADEYLSLPEQKETQQEKDYREEQVAENKIEPSEHAHFEGVNLLEMTIDYLKKQFAELFKIPHQQINPQASLETYGIDSILTINMTNKLEKTFGTLSKTLMFEYQTIHELAEYFLDAFSEKLKSMFAVTENNNSVNDSGLKQAKKTEGKQEVKTNSAAAKTLNFNLTKRGLPQLLKPNKVKNAYNDDLIAIVGLSGRYPESPDIETYWDNLQNGKDCITEIPKDRWDWREYYTKDRTKDGYHFSKWGGFIEGHNEFDPKFFNISPKEAEILDPQERLFLQHAWMAMEDAGYTRDLLQIPHGRNLNGQVGVYVGVMYSEYQLFGAEISQQGRRMGFANSMADIANRVSYVLNIHGPSFTVDTMCSSSLSSIHLACQDLKQGKTDMAIAGGVNLNIHPNKYLLLSSGQYLSTNGYCNSFGEVGDGYVPGEGVGAVILKRLSDAKENGDHIYGVIRGSALNHGGKANGLTVPNPQAQAALISQVMEESNTDSRHISYIEAHGTGTALGDPIEITALTKAFNQNNLKLSEQDNEYGFCRIGSVKSNIGHCESAAGIAALTKVLLQMKHQKIVPSLHSKVLNPNIDFEKTPFIVNQNLHNWEKPVIDNKEIPRIAGISSFGAGGSNAHIIIEEYPVEQTVTVTEQNKKAIIPISARKPEQLKQKIVDLINFIEKEQDSVDLKSLAYTLQVGREPMEERLGFIVETTDELRDKLKACANSLLEGRNKHIEGVYQGQVKPNKESILVISQDDDMKETIEKWIARKKIEKLLDLWVKGLDLDWQKFYGDVKPKRISLPAYPFAKEKYWWNDNIKDGNLTLKEWLQKRIVESYIHPMLHLNTSDLGQQSYSTTFTGKETYLKDSPVKGQKVLPFAAYLEMARAAIEHALPDKQKSFKIELYNTVCAEPVLIDTAKTVKISLFATDDERVDFEIHSNGTNEDNVHCQGHAVINEKTALTPLNLEQLRKQSGQNQKLSEISMQDDGSNANAYVLHPNLLDNALNAANSLLAEFDELYSFPTELESVQIHSTHKKNMFAWIRYSQDIQPVDNEMKLDIDLCDEEGTICVQMSGIRYVKAATNSLKKKPAQIEASLSFEPKEITFLTESIKDEENVTIETQQPIFTKSSITKPSNIVLVEPAKPLLETHDSSLSKAYITLSNVATGTSFKINTTSVSKSVKFFEHGNGVFSIQFTKPTLSEDLINGILQAINTLNQNESVKILLIRGGENDFLQGNGKQHNAASNAKLYEAIGSFSYPVIADMRANAGGAGFMLGAVCDMMICSEEAIYNFTNIQENLYPSIAEFNLFKERFGVDHAFDLLYVSTKSTGKALKEKGWSFPILPKNEIEAYIQKTLLALAKKPQKSLQLLKKHLARDVNKLVSELVIDKRLLKTNENTSVKKNNISITTSKNIKTETHEHNVLVVTIDPVNDNYLLSDYVSDVKEVLSQVKPGAAFKAIVLKNNRPETIEKSNKQLSLKSILEYSDLILNNELPIISVLDANSKGIIWLLSLFTEYTVYSKNAIYSATELMQATDIVGVSGEVLAHRFGFDFGKEILLSNTAYSGSELQQRVKSLTVVGKEKALQTAIEIAQQWAMFPDETMLLVKQNNASFIGKKIKNITVSNIANEIFSPVSQSSTPIILNSKVISASADRDGVMIVKMEDRDAKNMFSEALTQGIIEVFDHIEKTPAYKVVILTGFDNYFAAGGTKEDLYSIQEGKAKFTDTKFYHLAMECKIPVISAIQGHAIGAGWSYGMFSDFILFSEESKYLSPYMNFGFTPGAGATFVLPKKLGYDLARETLFRAEEVGGNELKNRGLRFPIMSRKLVLPAAVNLARQIAKYSRQQLISVKHQLTQHYRSKIEETYNLELTMHDETFVGQSEILRNIQDYFSNLSEEKAQRDNSVISTKKAIAQSLNTGPQAKPANKKFSKITDSELLMNLKNYLAQELHMETEEVDDDVEFIDLGLDSITGVTWVRKINDKYNLSIEATKVYSYPTLIQFSQFVKNELEKNNESVTEEIVEISVETESQQFTSQASHSKQTKISNETFTLSSVTSQLKGYLAQELHMEESEIDDDTEFIDLGLDSITGVTWVRKINDEYELNIEATKVYSYPTLNDFSKFIKDEIEKQGKVPSEINNVSQEETLIETPLVLVQSTVNNIIAIPVARKLESWRKQQSGLKMKSGVSSKTQLEPVAIIGMAGQFPKAKDLEEFWYNISQGKDCISQVPKARWDLATYFSEGDPKPGKTNCQWLGSLEDYDKFDPLFFNIAPTEAESMDPQQRLFLQTCWNTIENAGYKAKSLSGSKCGVFVGSSTGDYHLLSEELQLSAKGFTGSATSVLASRISYFLNLKGACLTIDTACSSSLVAIATACNSLMAGDSDMALAGGVCVMATPGLHIKSSQTGMLSQDGKCYTFDDKANGFVPGEGVGVIMLKRLSDAEKDQDNILGVIEGWGINQDGKTNGITAPNPESQKRLMQDIYDKFKIDPTNIQLIEAHGTGTKLGDPIEVGALVDTFSNYTQKKGNCALGSVKTNIGHTMAAAGVAGVLKVVLSLKKRKLPPTINFEKLNEHIKLENSPFYVNNQLKDWNGSERHFAAVSSFGFSGTNGHLVIAEYQPKQKVKLVANPNSEFIIPLSARNSERLKQKAKDFLDFIKQKTDVDLHQMAYTLQVGREEMESRLGFLVKNIDELSDKLQAYVEGKNGIVGVFHGQINHSKEGMQFINQDTEVQQTLLEKWLKNNQNNKLLEGWVKGLSFDWNSLYGKIKPQKIELPLYPFAKERYWVGTDTVSTSNSNQQNNATIHPLLHQNTSNLNQQSYTSTFTGEEFFLRDHQVKLGANGASHQKVLPGVAYLEMARAAVENAMDLVSEGEVLELQNIIWVRPLVVSEMKEISIALWISDEMMIDFEIYGFEHGNRVEYCLGQAIITSVPANVQINLSQLEEEMQVGQLDHEFTYEILKRMGLYYGPAHQGVKVIYQGHEQVLAKLMLPEVAQNNHNNPFVLHPSMLDSALQAAIGFTEDLDQISNQPSIPFALDSIRVLAPCKKNMYSWARYTSKANSNANLTKLDIDLIDKEGNICVQIEGFTSRTLNNNEKIHYQDIAADLVSVNSNIKEHDADFNAAHYETILKNIVDKGVSVDEAVNMEE